MVRRSPLQRWVYVWTWRSRYWWMDTKGGWWGHLALAAVLACVSAHQIWLLAHAPLPTLDQPQKAFVWWVQLIIMIVAALVSYALTPKPEEQKPQTASRPTVEDGQGQRKLYGTHWIDDSIVLGWRQIKTTKIKKSSKK